MTKEVLRRRYLERPRLIFVHIPKTAGTSVADVISRADVLKKEQPSWRRYFFGRKVRSKHDSGRKVLTKHASALEYKCLSDAWFAESYKFSVVRNPWDWAWSFYRFIRYSEISPDSGRPWRHNLFPLVKDLDFPEFVEFVAIRDGFENLPEAGNLRALGYQGFNQFNFIHDLAGESLVNKVIRFENLQSEFNGMMAELGYGHLKLPKVNVSKKIGHSYRDAYSETTKQLIETKFRLDIESFDYSF